MARRIAYLVGSVVLVASAVYAFVYLYRWEWNRALFMGVLFIATQLTLVSVMTFDRLRRIERRLDEVAAGEHEPAAPVTASEAAAAPEDPFEPHDHFGWLRDSLEQPNVFVPILLGAGALVSGLAWLSERLAFRIATRRRDAALVAAAAGSRTAQWARHEPPPRPPSSPLTTVLAVIAMAVVVGVGIDRLGDATQTRPEQMPPDSTMEVVFEVDTRGSEPEERAASRLWAACASQYVAGRDGPVHEIGDDVFVVETQPALDRYRQRELLGCLEDVTLDFVLGDVVEVRVDGVPQDDPLV